ncbi:uncharacterized protein LOC116350396 isoform X1 [Contarinia nasturtii]|uniref:uncharacterized protein LOC116350396 isoform X1 n=1 Tax=Contarinia nasturtii TaxID=265458 RepID=UPI0012D3940C|nr:uncharacterized protein LOC116350396 isoform X1 [Contarinia nasturtii]
MKQFIFLALFSILVFDQVTIKGAAGHTYEELCKTFSSKAYDTLSKAGRGRNECFKDYEDFDWYSELLVLFTFVDTSATSIPYNIDFLNKTNKKIDLYAAFNGEDYRGALSNQRKLNDLLTNIEENISVKLRASQSLGEETKTMFDKWLKKKVTQDQLKAVVNTRISQMSRDHIEMSNDFIRHMNQVAWLAPTFEQQTEKMRRDFENSFDDYVPLQENILKHLNKAAAVFSTYESARSVWATFLMSP